MENFQEFLSDLKNLIACKSVLGEAKENAPFGEGVKEALDCFLDIAKRFGFSVQNHQNYLGEITFGGNDESEEFGIIGHVDVVPVGTGWDTNPFVLTEKEGKLFGRGIADDKAPLLLCLYAMKALKDEGVVFNKKVRLFVGCDEESGWRDVEYFNKVSRFPKYGFSPDGNFPVIYAEKGMNIITFHLDKLKNFDSLSGGTVVNAVCGYATVKQLTSVDSELLHSFGLSLNKNGEIESIGISCHGSMPEKGKNALAPLFDYFRACGENVDRVCEYLFRDKSSLRKLGNEQGYVTLSPNLIRLTDRGIDLVCDCRTPAPISLEDIKPYLDSFGIKYSAVEKHPPFMVDKNDEFVLALLSAYNERTGENATPQMENGSTFARVFEKGCAFGAEFPDTPSTIHQANENMAISDIKKMYEIYKLAIKNLVTK